MSLLITTESKVESCFATKLETSCILAPLTNAIRSNVADAARYTLSTLSKDATIFAVSSKPVSAFGVTLISIIALTPAF